MDTSDRKKKKKKKKNLTTVWLQNALQLKTHGSHLSSKTTQKCLNVCEQVEVLQRNKDIVPIYSPPVNSFHERKTRQKN